MRRGPRLIRDPVWERKGSDVLDFLRGKIGEERFCELFIKYFINENIDWSSRADISSGKWSMYERHKHALEDDWIELGPEVSFDEPLYWNFMAGESEIALEEYDRERKVGDREPEPGDGPPDEGAPVKAD